MTLHDPLPDTDYAFRMRFRQGTMADFYGPTPDHEALLAERRRWLHTARETCTALLPEGVPLLEETLERAVAAGSLPGVARTDSLPARAAADRAPIDRCQWLGEHWEPDFLLLRPDPAGVFRLVGGCLCFPSHWDLQTKMGRSMAAIHAPVPGLNDQLGRQIDGFLQRIKPGISWERVNWGLSRSPERNLHPTRPTPRLDAHVTLEEVWWRLEEQSLVALPATGGILFGIRIVLRPFREFRDDPVAKTRMRRALATMPASLAAYKGLEHCRQRLLDLLDD